MDHHCHVHDQLQKAENGRTAIRYRTYYQERVKHITPGDGKVNLVNIITWYHKNGLEPGKR
ncbi:unnamed protein product [Dovyalis caffra]|uniref:Uncharacterized protein n=1 Tax=Dovyalis caffra TaxID=77055 RepID=A0AAV1S4V4_9ROSI|nr:unnamed protein product [Dovyalis caffra]